MIVFRTRWMGTFILSRLMNVPIHLPGMIIYVVTTSTSAPSAANATRPDAAIKIDTNSWHQRKQPLDKHVLTLAISARSPR